IFILLSSKTKFASFRPVIPLTLLLGALGAIASCLTGYFLANSGDYEGKLVSLHQWMGIAVAIISLFLYVLYVRTKARVALNCISIFLIVLISITGHLGGSLTHGEDYLTAPLKSGGGKNQSAIPAIPNIQDAVVYESAIMPLFKSRCYSCHGSEKQKGKLRLDEQDFMLKGGKNGPAIIAGKAEDSELVKRLLLPLDNDKHMAPKEKPQLTENELTLIQWWINQGADFKKKFKELPQPANMKTVLANLANGNAGITESKVSEIPEKEVVQADVEVLKKLTNAGITIVPVSQNTNYLSANFINADFDQPILVLIPKVEKQLIWVKLDNKKVNDQVLAVFGSCKNLTRLSLNNSSITDRGLMQLTKLDQLQYLSLVGTKVSMGGIRTIAKLKKLKSLYIYQTNIKPTDYANLKKMMPNLTIDTGGYSIPFLAQDTIVVKAPAKM
ncbi:MAG: c-type cytochrome domain-containing protein, partial [Pedobacter sp.]|nr:c-type cytochrome domain-containing protein [Pedobacter sp.]